jgi:hypothetical protein
VERFLELVTDVAGPANASLAAGLLYNNGVVDFAVDRVESRPVTVSKGYLTQTRMSDRIQENFDPEDDDSPELVDDLFQWGADASEGDPENPVVEKPDVLWEWEVLVRNRGNLALPVTLHLNFEGGKTELKEWDGKGGIWRLKGQGPDRLLSAVVDPEAKYALDLNRLNNERAVAFNRPGVLYLAGWMQFWLQNYFNGWAFLN